MNRRNFFGLLGLGIISTKITFTENPCEQSNWSKWSITDDCNKSIRGEISNDIIADEYSGYDIDWNKRLDQQLLNYLYTEQPDLSIEDCHKCCFSEDESCWQNGEYTYSVTA